ncbi:hypothetical protein WMY93_033999 [Mugilogobius chulae]|uniref:SAM domain-containing protein n=1 Tax=Mugilogobius chulae TaxID=88201 RepID=A0AAW0MFS9_9GOBI
MHNTCEADQVQRMERKTPLEKWDEDDVSSWLRCVGIKENYISSLKKEEVTGPVLATLNQDDFEEKIGMKSGQIQLLLTDREELLKTQQKEEEKESQFFCDFCKFDQDPGDFRYTLLDRLLPETGSDKMLVACHEFKSLEKAQNLESEKLKIKVALELLRFACACMNMRANGTIHFGVMDSVNGPYRHGEIIGIEVHRTDDFVDALDYIERCFKTSVQQDDARKCIRNPRFIEVTGKKTYVVEYDVVPEAKIVKGQLYTIKLPKYSEKNKKTVYEELAAYKRVGANSVKFDIPDYIEFYQSLPEKDELREEAESTKLHTTADFQKTQDRKLKVLLTAGKKLMDNSLSYIIVTNKFYPQDKEHIDFLRNMKLFCVFDFDPDSSENGFCEELKKNKAITPHFLNDYVNEEQSDLSDFTKKLGLFEKPSWIFCNGRKNFHRKEEPCDNKTWIKTRKKELKKAVSLICNELLPRNSFIVVFLLRVRTFSEFYTEMKGLDNMVILSESKKYYKQFSSRVEVFCDMSTLDKISVTEMPLSHMNATVQSFQLSKKLSSKTLPTFNGGLCFLKSADETKLSSLEIISADQYYINEREKRFYHGSKIDWLNFWLSDKQRCGEIIKRDAFDEVNTMIKGIVHSPDSSSIKCIYISHHPGSGGSTVARQLLWSWKKKVRCAVVKHNKVMTLDRDQCLPVLLLLEDHETEDIDHLQRELRNSIITHRIMPTLCFILLICNRSDDPQKACTRSPTTTESVTKKLSENETRKFLRKKQELQQSKGFEESYIADFVKNILKAIDQSSAVTCLIRFIALLNSYVDNSHLSVSHCQAFLGLCSYSETKYHRFIDSLSDEAKLLLVDLRDDTTHLLSLRINHKLVAKELLNQLSHIVPQSTIAKDLITNPVLLKHRFGRDEFLKFIRALVIREDDHDTAFSPLITHIKETEGLPKAIELLKDSYNSLGKDGFVAQQLARLLYTNKRFDEALEWAEKAKSRLPHNTFILDTVGQVYKQQFFHLFDNFKEEPTPEEEVLIISTALQAISAFRDSENTPNMETVSLNSSYYGEVDVACKLLSFLSKVNVFANYIPDTVQEPWQEFHEELKGIRENLKCALNYISKNLCSFETENTEEDEELDARDPDQIYNLEEWLIEKERVYADFFIQKLDVSSAMAATFLSQRQDVGSDRIPIAPKS